MYIELFLLDNFLMNLLTLRAAAAMLSRKMKGSRAALVSFAGAAAAAAAAAALTAGKVDAWVVDNEVALAMAPELGLTVLDEAMTSEPYAFAFQKGSELVAPFNEALDALLADGTVEQIFQQYGVTYIAP